MWEPSPGFRHRGSFDPELRRNDRIVSQEFFAPEYVRQRNREKKYYEGYNRVSGDGQGTYWP